MRNVPALAERRRARRYRLPRIFGWGERRAAFPGTMRRSLASRVRQLDSPARRAAEPAGGVQGTLERCLVLVAVQAQARVSDAATAFDGCRLDDDQASTAV